MKNHLLKVLLLLLGLGPAVAQSTLYATNSGETRFFSETPAENISAVNTKSQAILNTATGELAVRMNIRDFSFPNKLMQEHFNENYMESDKYPTATFRGKMEPGVDYTRKGTYAVTAQGTLTVHGQSQERTFSGQLTVSDASIELQTNFDVALTDHKIEVPKLVFMKIAQVINVKARYVLKPYKK